jgi:hypothetical protein
MPVASKIAPKACFRIVSPLIKNSLRNVAWSLDTVNATAEPPGRRNCEMGSGKRAINSFHFNYL